MHRRDRKPAKRKQARVGTRWQLQQAKANLSEMVRESQKRPQIITIHGRDVAVIQSVEDYRRLRFKKQPKTHWLDVLLKCPPGPDLVIHRDPNDTIGAGRRPIFD